MEKDEEAAGARKGSDVQIRAVSHLFTLWVVGNVTLSVIASYGNCTARIISRKRGRRKPVFLQQSPERPEPCRPHT